MTNNEKLARKYTKLFCSSMKKAGRYTPSLYEEYKNLYLDLTDSAEYKEFSKYKTMGINKVYAAITHTKLCQDKGISLDEARNIWEKYTAKNIRRIFRTVCKVIDILPNGYKIVSGWLYDDAQKRINENCLTYEFLDYTDKKLQYKITRCAYIELFEKYGIKKFCKVFCNNDLCMQVMHRKAKFIRHSDLTDGNCCYDEIINLKEKHNVHK